MLKNRLAYKPGPVARPPSMGATVGLLAFVAFLALFLGLVIAAYPVAFTVKLAVFVFGAVILVYAVAAAAHVDDVEAGRFGRGAVNLWVFLLGACPDDLPFKFGPLPGLNPLRLAFGAILAAWVYSLITSQGCALRSGRGWRTSVWLSASSAC